MCSHANQSCHLGLQKSLDVGFAHGSIVRSWLSDRDKGQLRLDVYKETPYMGCFGYRAVLSAYGKEMNGSRSFVTAQSTLESPALRQ